MITLSPPCSRKVSAASIFGCILPGANSASAARYAEHLRKTIEEYVFLKRRFRGLAKAIKLKGQITASIGVASLKHGKKVTVTSARDELIRRADRGMYDAKEGGRNRITVKK